MTETRFLFPHSFYFQTVSWFIKNRKPNTTAILSSPPCLIANSREHAQWPIAFLYWKFDINNPVERSPREATSNSAGQQTRRPLCNGKVHYRIHLLTLPEEDYCCSSPDTLFILGAFYHLHLALPLQWLRWIYYTVRRDGVFIRRVTYCCNGVRHRHMRLSIYV